MVVRGGVLRAQSQLRQRCGHYGQRWQQWRGGVRDSGGCNDTESVEQERKAPFGFVAFIASRVNILRKIMEMQYKRRKRRLS